MYVTVQVPSNLHSIQTPTIGDHGFTLQPVHIVQPGVATPEQALIATQVKNFVWTSIKCVKVHVQ